MIGKFKLAASAAVAGVVAGACVIASPASAERLTMGATFSSSAFYAYQAAMANAIGQENKDLQISVRELGGAAVATESLLRGEVNMGIAVTATDYKAMRGEAPFKQKNANLRTLWYFAPLPLNFVVAKDEGIKAFKDLDGKSFSPGGRGTSTEAQAEAILKVLGIQPKLDLTDGSDALQLFQNRRMAGFVKGGVLPDGYIQQAASARAIDFLSLTPEEAAKIIAAYPYFSEAHIVSEPDKADFITVQTAIGINATSEMSEKLGYEIAKVVFSKAGHDAAAGAYPPSEKFDPVKLTLSSAVAPLQAGVAKYLEEQGYKIPARLMPPEGK